MVQRIMVAVICVPLIFLIFFGLPPICIPIMFSLLSMIGVHEVLWSTGFVKHARISGYSIVFAGLVPFWVYFGSDEKLFLLGILCYVTLVFVEALASHYTVTLEKMGGAFFFSIMIPFFLSSFVRIDAIPEIGVYYILLPLVAAFMSDACALFAGMAFGKHKLAPELSPHKTVEGAVGGFAGFHYFLLPLRADHAAVLSVTGQLSTVGPLWSAWQHHRPDWRPVLLLY